MVVAAVAAAAAAAAAAVVVVVVRGGELAFGAHTELELELELLQSHMAQKAVLRVEVGCACVAREVSVKREGMGERGCARRLGGWVWV